GDSTSAQLASVDRQVRLDATGQLAEERHRGGESGREIRSLPSVNGFQYSASARPDFVRLAGAAWFGMLPMDHDCLPGSAPVPMSIPDRIEHAHVAALRRSTALFEDWDHQFGGGLARAAMSGQLEWACRVLRGSSMTSEVRRGWQLSAARLGDLVGFSSAERVFA
ncbi:MAG TPA: hypothetical protein VFM55_07450, partial [Micromonosporaceae bacterium]|nr:hypothetical protein [Micromonosporaceae bacterium]